ncbi:MAG TPA: efflux RND transporter permease subunit [Phycisphaerales bacterium]|nr:efflux RND transporter permease subunit [Phycisphaerales bacterium]HMP35851.1 efflux RND transporter permease subunit [Phycisphaerales bacterium]
MNIGEASIRYSTFTMAATVAMCLGGLLAYFQMGRLEDPEFTIKEALVVTAYPGASALEVADEVTDPIESAVQRMGQLDRVESVSEPGLSTVRVFIRDRFTSAELPQVWDELRRRVIDAERSLPPGAATPVVRDDFGDVYGVFYAIYGDGFGDADLEEYAKTLRRELLLVEDVGSVQLFGVQQEVIYVEFSPERLANLGMGPDSLHAVLVGQNLATPAGLAMVGPTRLRVDPTGQFKSVDDIANLLLLSAPDGAKLYLRDVAEVTRGYIEPATVRMSFNGRPAVGLAISTVQGGNVVRMGEAVTQRLRELESQIPVGIEIGLIAHQADTVTEAIGMFVSSLIQAFAIVIGTLMIFMGLRSGFIIGVVLVLTVLGTFAIMHATGVMLERVSLGALVIALALMVDNAIVVVDGMQVMIQRGVDRIEAAGRVVKQTAMPLFGATMVAIFAFAAIGLSQDRTGEYTRSLFLVMLYSLLLSWVLGITITPLLAYWLLAAPKDSARDPYAGVVYRAYDRMLAWFIRWRWPTLAVTLVLLVTAIGAFRYVERNFFPPSTRPQFMVHIWHPQGTTIEETEVFALEAAEWLRGLDGVTDVAAFAGTGAPRFLLTYTPEPRNPSYSMLLVSVKDHRIVDGLLRSVEEELRAERMDAKIIARQFALGPGDLQKVQVRLRGPDPDTLHALATEAKALMAADPDIVDLQDDWRDRVPVVRPIVAEIQARDAGLTRRAIAAELEYVTQGRTVGVYREGDTLLPIVARPLAGQRERISDIEDAQIWSPIAERRIPMRQVIAGLETASEHTFVHRRNRLPTVTIFADARSGNANSAVLRLIPQLEGIELPPGYSLEWGGEFESSRDAQLALAGNIPLVGLLMVLTVIALFNAIRPPLIVFAVVPLAIIGVTFGLLVTGQPFGFMALLGFMSLAGMLIKNAIVLLDEIGAQMRTSDDPIRAIRQAAMSRMSPVILAALTTVLGMIPLLPDAFFVAMAVTIMAGLTFATVLTLVMVPVLYAVLFRLRSKEAEDPRPAPSLPATAS